MKQTGDIETVADGTARILIVDDEAAQLKALCDTLRERGYETAGLSNGRAALKALQEREFDVLLTDLMMPGIDGITLLGEALKIRPDIVGIIMTGEGTVTTAVEAMKIGALDYILKPFKLSGVMPVLSRALTVRRLRLEKLELEERLRKRTAQLETANKELQAFSYSISHDLRAPLRAMNGFAAMLQKSCGETLPKEGKDFLERIRVNAVQMGELVEGLLNFSSLSWMPVTKKQVDPKKLAQSVWDELKADLDGTPVQMEIADLPLCHADAMLLRQVFINLVSNAVKYSRRRSPAIVQVGCQTEEGKPVYFIRDNGAGFDMQYADKLFGVFQRLHRADEFEGTGVGLAIVQRVVQRHGGRIWATAEPDKGATFFFTLGDDQPNEPMDGSINNDRTSPT